MYLSRKCVLNIDIERVTRINIVSVFSQETLLINDLNQDLVYELRVTYDSNYLRQHDFITSIIEKRNYLDLVRIHSLLYFNVNSIFRIIININNRDLNVINNFRQKLNDITLNYARFYSKHFDRHFLQFDDYSLSHNRFTVCISIIVTFDN